MRNIDRTFFLRLMWVKKSSTAEAHSLPLSVRDQQANLLSSWHVLWAKIAALLDNEPLLEFSRTSPVVAFFLLVAMVKFVHFEALLPLFTVIIENQHDVDLIRQVGVT